MTCLCHRGGPEGCCRVENAQKDSAMSLTLHMGEVWRRPVRVETSMENPAGKLFAAGPFVCASCMSSCQRIFP